MTSVGRQRAAVATGLRTFLREPTNLGLLVVLPPIVLLAFDLSMDVVADVPGLDVPSAAAELGGALFATAFLAGLLGLFQVVGAADPDRRLIVCGFRPWEMLLARVLTIGLASALVTGIVYVIFLTLSDLTPASHALAIVSLLVAALIYGLIGVLIGAVLNRELVGSLVLVFLADYDAFASLGVIPMDHTAVDYVPLSHPSNLLDSAVHDGTVATADALIAVTYVVGLAVLTLAAVTLRGDSS
ncbi:ABC transporter permease [Natranaeroarchaeum aerophilus]|uniref:ABC transporter permease n=1 Tax=Natranaeroarchaeum aerophilus TaxID=2917711 RepID=A0AAE3FTW4_9EURY|nr:ABC transporter permease [Natranaeroarchaeum aerophilus]MCL9814504.1 ABC transporter permease [Natranaeroarchaeum aerophilus]